MSAEADTDPKPETETEARPKRRLLPILATVALAGAGFASTYLGVWAPQELLASTSKEHAVDVSVAFVEVPPIEITLTSGRHRSLQLASTIETEKSSTEDIETLMPRVVDSFNGFLAGIDPGAFDKRGVLEIVKHELTTRAHEALPGLPVSDLLITEFRLK